MRKSEYELRISDWSSDVCSSDLDEAVKAAADGPLGAAVVVEPAVAAPVVIRKRAGRPLVAAVVADPVPQQASPTTTALAVPARPVASRPLVAAPVVLEPKPAHVARRPPVAAPLAVRVVPSQPENQLGRASCRERGCQDG